MCCVMPPVSCVVRFVFLMVSRRDVLPWSTCPMTVMMGALGCSLEGSVVGVLVCWSVVMNWTL